MMTFDPHHVEIDGGTICATVIEDASGRQLGIGDFRFFVAVVEADGCRLVLWDGGGYDEAIREAEVARRDFDIDGPAHDMIGGGQ